MRKTRICPGCKESKSITEFGQNIRRSDGLAYYCKECFREISKKSYRRTRAAKGQEVREQRGPAPAGLKWCPDCEAYRALDDFPGNRTSRDGLSGYCKPHHNARGRESRERVHGGSRHYHLFRRYGTTAAQVEEMIGEQAGVCLICQRLLGDKPHVDHDHETGAVRGILCFNCNGGLGQFGDDVARLQQAVEYLEGNLQPSARAAAEAEQRLVDLICRLGRAA